MEKTTNQIIEELGRIASTMDVLGDFKKASVIKEACTRLHDLDSMARFFREEAIAFVRSE